MLANIFDSVARVVTYAVGTGILVNVLDDAFVDARYFFGRLDTKAARVVSHEALRDVERKRIAIMLPAWKEADVIEEMLEHNLALIDYPQSEYAIFCGTYENDAETQERVDSAARRFASVHKVVVPHAGPTSKADCLNWIYQGIILEEQRTGTRFDILLMHDAEDLIHPLSLRLYSLLIPPNDFVQTPVFSLPLPKRRFVAGTYIDEFAEHHQKDMRVREAIGGLVPSAGVGSAFARAAFDEIAAANGEQPFNVDSLTEDYEIGLKFRLAGRRAHFACCTVEREVNGRKREEFIATRELFPSGFRASVRQRSRWILGITMQTWAQVGWRGSLPVIYCLWRDRKALLTNILLLCAYALVLYFFARTAMTHGFGSIAAAPILPPGSPFAFVLGLNFAFAGWRLAMKARFVGRLYGPGHALLSAPRLVLGNVIGVLATGRAAYQFLGHKITGEPLRWLKTAHEFPTAERLAHRQRLGEYLIQQRAISQADLDEALSLQHSTGARLGDVLTSAGLTTPAIVTAAIAKQHALRSVEPDPATIPLALLRRLPEKLAEDLALLPLEERDGRVVLATEEPLDDRTLAQVEAALGAHVEVCLAPPLALRAAREHAYRRLVSDPPPALHVDETPTASIPPWEVDRGAVSRLGLGFCTFYAVVPLRSANGEPLRLLSAAPLHDDVRATIALRLDTTPRFEVVHSAATLRVALAGAEGALPATSHADLFGLDDAEWHALSSELPPDVPVTSFVADARARGLSPLDYLEELRADEPTLLARARAHTFGLRLTERGPASAAGLLPPSLVAEHDVTILKQDNEAVELAAPRPTPHLAQQVAAMLAPLKVAWSVAPSQGSFPVLVTVSTRGSAVRSTQDHPELQ